MKKQTYGTDHLPDIMIHRTVFGVVTSSLRVPLARSQALQDYKNKRQNGKKEDEPTRRFPKDGICGFETPNETSSRYLYIEGFDDHEWMAECDRNYIARLERDGCTNEIEQQDLTEWRQIQADRSVSNVFQNSTAGAAAAEETQQPTLVDHEWMAECDRSYIARLERDGCTNKTEWQDLAQWRQIQADRSVSNALQNPAAAGVVLEETQQAELDLHNRYLGYSQPAIYRLLNGLNPRNLLELNLSYNIDRTSYEVQSPNTKGGLCNLLSNFLEKNPSLTALNISYNMVDSIGLEELSEAMLTNRKLETISLSGNHIVMGKTETSEMEMSFSRNTSLRSVNISHNHLEAECDELLSNSLTSSRAAASSALFVSLPESVSSLMEPNSNKTITQADWLVALACRKKSTLGEEHAMIYLEGMRPSGQRFLERYHISAGGAFATAKLRHEVQVPKLFKAESYFFNAHSITRAQGRRLQSQMKRQKESTINFSLFSGSASGRVNCLDWAIHELKLIEISVNKKLLPSWTAKQSKKQASGYLTM